jgi:hypothetical protein
LRIGAAAPGDKPGVHSAPAARRFMAGETGSPWSARKPPISPPAHPGKTATSKVSVPDCATNFSTARSHTLSERLELSWNNGGATTIPCDLIYRSDTNPRPPKSSSPLTVHCRPYPTRWQSDPQFTNIPTGPLHGGRSNFSPAIIDKWYSCWFKVSCYLQIGLGSTAP